MDNNKIFRYIGWLLFILYAAILIKLILIKKPIEKYHEPTERGIKRNFKKANYIPFHTIGFYLSGKSKLKYALENLIGNIIIFIPLAIFVPLLLKNFTGIRKVILITFFIRLAFEIIQLFTLFGSFDVDDLILNSLGGIIGYMIFIVIYNLFVINKKISVI